MGRKGVVAKSSLQVRAEKCAQKFAAQQARKPIVIEFAGLPKAGKTTTLNSVQAFLKRCGFRVKVVVERASVCPIRDKRHANFNVWTASTTLAQILEHTQTPPRADDPDVLILDRGIFDAICWLSGMEKLARLRAEDRKAIEQFLLRGDWCKRINGVVLMTASAKDALEREKGYLPVVGQGGSIMNAEVLASMKKVLDQVATRMSDAFRIYKVNTSARGSTPKKTSEDVAAKVVGWIEEELKEDILALSKTQVEKAFGKKPCIGSKPAQTMVDQFCRQGHYGPRAEVERDMARVQALPVVVVKNKSGEILTLRRKERREGSELHERIVIWAGGHVRKEDSEDGNPITSCAVRELEEELRLAVRPEDLGLLGAIHSKVSGGTTKHVAIVYEWRADTDDVEVALSNSEFFERRGNSQSGSFVPIDHLLKEYEANKLTEDWSCHILTTLMRETSARASRDLFHGSPQ